MTISRVQFVTINLSGGTSATTGAITVGSGNLLIGDVWASNGNGASLHAQPAVSDSQTQTWATAIAQWASGQAEEDYVAAAAGGSTTFTLTLAGGGFGRIIVTEVTGQAASPLDKTSTLSDTGVGPHTCTPTATTSQADELWHGAAADMVNNAFHTFTIGGSFVVGANVPDSPSPLGGISGDYVVAAIGTAAFQFSDAASGSDLIQIMTSTWKAAAGGGGGFKPSWANQATRIVGGAF